MSKKLLIVILVRSFCAVMAPMSSLAANQPEDNALLENTLNLMQSDVETIDHTGDLGVITSSTKQLIGDLLLVLKEGDASRLSVIIADYVAEVQLIGKQDLVEECSGALVSGVFFSSVSLLQTVAGAGDAGCLLINATNSIADILSDLQSYQLCVIENSGDPDEELQAIICKQKGAIETCDFITNWLDVVRCTPDPGFSSYLGLLINLIGIFTPCP
jgi:hypothetical protein